MKQPILYDPLILIIIIVKIAKNIWRLIKSNYYDKENDPQILEQSQRG
jgi:hypothetical protein